MKMASCCCCVLSHCRKFQIPSCDSLSHVYFVDNSLAYCRELPRVLSIYDISVPLDEAKAAIRQQFYEHKDIKDYRVQEMLIEQGYFSLETTLLQHKQKSHLMRYFEGYIIPVEAARKRLSPSASIDEQFARS